MLDEVNGKKLDKYQRKVVNVNKKNLLVLAGAGCGKTFTITLKVKKLINEGIMPNEILCISFTRDSAMNLESKLSKEGIFLKVRTFHSLGYEIVRKYMKVTLDNGDILNRVIDKVLNGNRHLKDITGVSFVRFGRYDKVFDILENNILLYSGYIDRLKIVINSFVNLYKCQDFDIDVFDEFNRFNNENHIYDQKRRHRYFLNMMKYLIKVYKYELKKNSKIDYHDMINYACSIAGKTDDLNYKYIIVDEYQDTSFNKTKLIMEIQKKCLSHVMVVGDDWQSIYSFTGSNLEIFTNFKKMFKSSKVIKLKYTYRLSYELLRVSSKFICKNPFQFKKRLKSNYYINKPICICYYDDINEVLSRITSKIDDYFILGRNNSDVNIIPKYKDKFLTIHRSKGLEVENTIIIVDNIPSKVLDSNYLKYVKPRMDDYIYSEERRLFYVALTRCRKRNYLLVRENCKSVFIQELLRDYLKYIEVFS